MRQRHRAVSLQLFLLVASTVLGAPLVAGQRLDGSLPVVTAQLELSVPSPANTGWTFPALGPLTVDDQGRLYVIDAGDQLIYVFTSRGELTRKLGRRGGGPGEFTNGRSLVVLRDSLWVIDTQNNRVTGIALGGNPGARTFAVSAPMVMTGGTLSVMAIAPRGIISYHPAASAFNSPLGGVSGYIAHVDETGKLLNTIAPVTSARRGVRVSDHDFQHIIDSLATSAKPRRLGQLYGDKAAIADSMYRPAFWPPVDRAVIGFDETIWLRRGDTDGKHTWFWLLSDKAVPEASVSLPYGFVLVRATRDLVWGWRPDSDGVPVVERYRLRR